MQEFAIRNSFYNCILDTPTKGKKELEKIRSECNDKADATSSLGGDKLDALVERAQREEFAIVPQPLNCTAIKKML